MDTPSSETTSAGSKPECRSPGASGQRRRMLRWAVVAGIMLLAVTAALLIVNRRQSHGVLAQARRALQQADFERAQSLLSDYVNERPSDAEAQLLLARTLRRRHAEDFEQARRHLHAAERLQAPVADLELERRALEFQDKGHPGLEAELQWHLEGNANAQRLTLEALFRGCLRSGRLDSAQKWLDAWVEKFPDDGNAHLWRGAVFLQQGKGNFASPELRAALAAGLENPLIKKWLGQALALSGHDFSEADTLLSSYLENHPGDVEALTALARSRRALDRLDEARTLLREALAAEPDHFDALRVLALVELDAGDADAALVPIRRMETLALQVDSRSAAEALARLRPVAYHLIGAERLAVVWFLAASAYRRLDNAAEAESYERRITQQREDIETLKREMDAIEKQPNDVALWERIGRLSLAIGYLEPAEHWLRRVLERTADPRPIHLALAECYEKRGDAASLALAKKHRRLADSK